MPQIRQVFLRQCRNPGQRIDGSRLQQLELVACSNRAFRMVFDCPNLTTFRLEDTRVMGPWGLPPRSSGYFPKLLNLSISGRVPRDFWKNGVFPVLETVRFKHCRLTMARTWGSVAEMDFSRMPKSTFPELRSVFVDGPLYSAFTRSWPAWNRAGVSLIVENQETPLP
jgi:hypothetical protein